MVLHSPAQTNSESFLTETNFSFKSKKDD